LYHGAGVLATAGSFRLSICAAVWTPDSARNNLGTMAEQRGSADAASRRRAWRFVGAIGTALLVAMATAIGTGLGSEVLDLFGGSDDEEADPISYSASEQIQECGTHLFVAEEQTRDLVSGAAPTPSPIGDWEAFQNSNGGFVADESVVQVSIQGESARTVTLTGIDFTVERQPRPPGAVFLQPCGDAIFGRYVVADLDREPVALSGTADDPDATLDPVDPVSGAAESSYKPITFPWTVSVTDPLLLQVVASTKRCYCTWRAEIPWSSGDRTGMIEIDNNGSGYTVVGSQGTTEYTNTGTGRSVWAKSPD
jgi:hypothetical protein